MLSPRNSPYDLVDIVLIWNTAPGSSFVSAWTVALMPMAARAPRTMPHGNQRNCPASSLASSLPRYYLGQKGVWCPYRLRP